MCGVCKIQIEICRSVKYISNFQSIYCQQASTKHLINSFKQLLNFLYVLSSDREPCFKSWNQTALSCCRTCACVCLCSSIGLTLRFKITLLKPCHCKMHIVSFCFNCSKIKTRDTVRACQTVLHTFICVIFDIC